MAGTIKPDEIIKIIENLQYVLYGVGVCIPVILFLIGFIFKYFSKRVQKLEGYETLCYRVGETEKYKTEIDEIKEELTELRVFCETKNKRKRV